MFPLRTNFRRHKFQLMKTLLLLVALTASTEATAEDRYFPADFLASELAIPFCQASLGPNLFPEDTVEGDTCVKVAADYLLRRGYDWEGDDWIRLRECAQRVILSHAKEAVPTDAILDAEFAGACQPSIM